MFKSVLRAGIVALLAGVCVPAALADSWGSVAYSPSTHAFGTSNDFDNEGEAASRALEACMEQNGGADCVTAVTFANGCGAVMAGPDGWGHAYDATEEAAQSRALATCSGQSGGCALVISHCSPGGGQPAD